MEHEEKSNEDLQNELEFLKTSIKGKKTEQAAAAVPEPSVEDEVERARIAISNLKKQAMEEFQMYLDEMERRRYLLCPEEWIEEKLGEYLWSKQRLIVKTVANFRRTAVPSCFASGKSFIAARIVAWWLDTHPPGTAFVVTTATTGAQVKAILWREIGRAHTKGDLPGRLNQTEWWMPIDGDKEEIVAFGRKPSDFDPNAFHGIHAPYVLVVLDEAAGIPEALFEAADSLIVNEDSRILAIGNPEDASSEFAKVCQPGSGWQVIRIPAFCTPNFSDEDVPDFIRTVLIGKTWVDEKRRKWGIRSPMWQAKILAEFPSSQVNGLFPIDWVRAAQERTLERTGPIELGVDVGGGGDESTIARRDGNHVRIIHKDQTPSTMETLGTVVDKMFEENAASVKVDVIGIGRGLVDRADQMAKDEEIPSEVIIGINVSQAATEIDEETNKEQGHKGFINIRAQGYWHLRELFESGDIDIDPEDEDLAAQLVAIRFRKTASGKIQIESKDEMARRGVASPNDLDAVMLSFLEPPPEPEVYQGAVWGKIFKRRQDKRQGLR